MSQGRKIGRLALLLVVAASAAGCRYAGQTQASAAPPPQMSAEELAMMEAMEKLATPSEGHQRLAPLVGRWRTNGIFLSARDAEPTESNGLSTHQWILDGRYLRQEFAGDFMGSPFHGIGYTGFNNATQQYEGTWMDTMSTMIMPLSTGTCDASGKVITSRRSYVDPMTGQETWSREVLTIVDADHHTFEWFGPDPATGQEFRMMKIDYTRK